MPAKTIVIGLDGATLDVIEPLQREGKIPTLSRIMKQGAFGKLRSTHPPSSAVAWPSFMTGKNPGKHSIFYFNTKHYGTYYSEPVTSNDIKSTTLWEELTKVNNKVAVVNVPMTYPPRKINGLMVTGLGTPHQTSKYTYPQEFAHEIEQVLGGRLPEVRWTEYTDENIPSFINDVRDLTVRTYDMSKYILEKELWDFFMVVFTGPDRIQHRLWDYLDYNNDHFSRRLQSDSRFRYVSDLIKNYFILLDEILAKLITRAGHDTNVIILSDHGAGKYSRLVDLNNLLSEWGYLSYREKSEINMAQGTVKSLAKRIGLSLKLVKKFAKLFGLEFDYYKYLEKQSMSVNKIDWNHTKAFCFMSGTIYINVKTRERHGTVDADTEYETCRNELISKLLRLKDPLTMKNIIKDVKKREDVYSGPYLKVAPDLIITDCDESYDFVNQLFSNDRNRSIFIDLDNKHQGTHRYDGFYAILGNNVKQNFRFDAAHITDLFPTILYLMDVSIPKDVDGRVLIDIFRKQDLEIRFSDKSSDHDYAERAISDEEKEKIVEELKGLGYM